METTNETSPLQPSGKRHGSRTSSSSSFEDDGDRGDAPLSPNNPLVSRFKMILQLLVLAAAAVVVIIIILHHQQPNRIPRGGYYAAKDEQVAVAFVGNSMFYFNDFPRFFQVLAAEGAEGGRRKRVVQNSCLHGGGSLPSLLLEGNGMFPQFQTPAAVLLQQEDGQHNTIYDYGACTVEQLLTGTDPRLDDPGYAVPEDRNSTNKNPCREDAAYLDYAKDYFQHQQPPYNWDFVVMNDNTRNPSRAKSRAHSLQFLEQFYVPWLLETKATPVFLWTHAYSVASTPTRSMTGLEDVANFTSLTGVGYHEYSKLLQSYLPEEQTPRIAPVGLAFLLVYEEDPALWATLFHSDHIHASPSGTWLQGCIVYATLFGELPPRDSVVRPNMTYLWKTARMMQHAWEPANPFPDAATANYLYRVAERIMIEGERPTSWIDYRNGEVAYEGE